MHVCVVVHDEEVTVSFSLPEYTPTQANDGMALILGYCPSIPLTSIKGRVRLDGAVRYLAACETLCPLGVVVHKLLHVLICLACKSCIIPSHMPGHLKEHGFKNIDKIAFTAACERWGIIQLPERVLHPSPRGAPVEILKTYQGYACAVDPTGCSFACTSENWMKQHVRNDHTSHPALMTSCYRSNVPVQTLFRPFHKKYIEVQPALCNVAQDNVLARVLQDFLPTLPLPTITPPQNDKEIDPLLRLMQWHKYMEPYYLDSAKHTSVLALKAPARQTDPAYHRLHTAVQDYIEFGIHIGRTVSPNLTVRKHLVQGRHLSSVPLSVASANTFCFLRTLIMIL